MEGCTLVHAAAAALLLSSGRSLSWRGLRAEGFAVMAGLGFDKLSLRRHNARAPALLNVASPVNAQHCALVVTFSWQHLVVPRCCVASVQQFK
jgi:hypothetical protein